MAADDGQPGKALTKHPVAKLLDLWRKCLDKMYNTNDRVIAKRLSSQAQRRFKALAHKLRSESRDPLLTRGSCLVLLDLCKEAITTQEERKLGAGGEMLEDIKATKNWLDEKIRTL